MPGQRHQGALVHTQHEVRFFKQDFVYWTQPILFRCEYFRTFLTTEIGCKSKVMEVREFSFAVLSTAVDFIYGIDIPESFNDSEDLKSLLFLSDLYLMDNLKAAVSSLMANELSEENILENIQLAELYRASLLMDECAVFILENVDVVNMGELEFMGGAMIFASLGKVILEKAEWEDPIRDLNNQSEIHPIVEYDASWIDKVFGEKADFKKREDFTWLKDYEKYVMSQIKPNMFVCCNRPSSWKYPYTIFHKGFEVDVGNIGFVVNTNFDKVLVKWLTMGENQGRLGGRLGKTEGAFEDLDLLFLPEIFN